MRMIKENFVQDYEIKHLTRELILLELMQTKIIY